MNILEVAGMTRARVFAIYILLPLLKLRNFKKLQYDYIQCRHCRDNWHGGCEILCGMHSSYANSSESKESGENDSSTPMLPQECQDCLLVNSWQNCADFCPQETDGSPPAKPSPCHDCLKQHPNSSWYDALWICADACPQVKGQNSANGPIANVFLISLVVVTRLLIFWWW